jgi:hypothetical protein
MNTMTGTPARSAGSWVIGCSSIANIEASPLTLGHGPSVKEQSFVSCEINPTRLPSPFKVKRDDLCLAEVCDRFLDGGIRDFFVAIPDEYCPASEP